MQVIRNRGPIALYATAAASRNKQAWEYSELRGICVSGARSRARINWNYRVKSEIKDIRGFTSHKVLDFMTVALINKSGRSGVFLGNADAFQNKT